MSAPAILDPRKEAMNDYELEICLDLNVTVKVKAGDEDEAWEQAAEVITKWRRAAGFPVSERDFRVHRCRVVPPGATPCSICRREHGPEVGHACE